MIDAKAILLTQFPFLSEADVADFLKIGQVRDFENKTIVIRAGQKPDRLFFILDVMVRGFYIDEYGEERTIFIRPNRIFFTAPEALDHQLSTKYSFETIQKTTLINFQFLKI